jgi:hypothetical protein
VNASFISASACGPERRVVQAHLLHGAAPVVDCRCPTLTTSSFSLSSAIAGRMRSRCRPFGYRSSGLKFEVVTKPTPLSNSADQQPVQDHRVGDVGDVELVEADQAVALWPMRSPSSSSGF